VFDISCSSKQLAKTRRKLKQNYCKTVITTAAKNFVTGSRTLTIGIIFLKTKRVIETEIDRLRARQK